MNGPYHTHDCEHCVYLGSVSASRNGMGRTAFFPGVVHDAVDLYFCPQSGLVPTVIARFGSDGPDYYSGIPTRPDHATNPFLCIAFTRAVLAGLYMPDVYESYVCWLGKDGEEHEVRELFSTEEAAEADVQQCHDSTMIVLEAAAYSLQVNTRHAYERTLS